MKHLLLLPFLLAPVLMNAQEAGSDMLAGMSALRHSDHPAAEQAFTKAVVAEPDNAKTWYYRAVSRMEAGDAQGAQRDLDRALELEPKDVHAYLRRAEAYRAMGSDERALGDLHKVLELRPNGPAAEHALLGLGEWHLKQDDRVSAKRIYDRLVEIAPLNAFGWCNRGIVEASLQMDEPALADLERALALDPTLDQAHVHMAIVLFRMDRRQEACHALHQARDLGDRSTEEMLLIYCD